MKIGERTYTDKKEAGTALIAFCQEVKTPNIAVTIGEYLGFRLNVTFDSFNQHFTLAVKGALSHNIEVSTDVFGNLTKINHVLEGIEKQLENCRQQLANTENQLFSAKQEVEKPFIKESELAEKMERLALLNALLNVDEKGGDKENIIEIPIADKQKEVAIAERKSTSIMEKMAEMKERMQAEKKYEKSGVKHYAAEI